MFSALAGAAFLRLFWFSSALLARLQPLGGQQGEVLEVYFAVLVYVTEQALASRKTQNAAVCKLIQPKRLQ